MVNVKDTNLLVHLNYGSTSECESTLKGSYKKIGDLSFGEKVVITYKDVELEDVEAEEGYVKTDVTRFYLVTNVGPKVMEFYPNTVFLTDMMDGTLVTISDLDVEVFCIDESENDGRI